MTDGTVTWNYTYNADGLRTKRTNGTATYSYAYVGSELEKLTVGTEKLAFAYDAEGAPLTVIWNGTYYFYLTNLQGDVIAITDETGTIVVQYTYDAWGNLLSTTGTLANTLGQYNPLRYRGYVYDQETGLYYLQSRYYNPEIGRFLNADNYPATGQGLLGNNMFAYCGNDPVLRVDPTGNWWDIFCDVVSLVVSVVEVVKDPTDVGAWIGLAGDVVDVVLPCVSGVGEAVDALRAPQKATKVIDKATDTIQITKAVDFTEDAADIVKTLDRSSGFTKSTASAGRKIHQGYKTGDLFNPDWKEYADIKGIRPDYVDLDNKIIYELKPMNPRGVRSGVRQLQRYNEVLGGGYTMILELY